MNPMDTLVARATDRLAELEHALHDLAQVRGRYTSPDGLITALVDGHGALIELHLPRRSPRFPPARSARWSLRPAQQPRPRRRQRRDEILAQLTAAFAGRAE